MAITVKGIYKIINKINRKFYIGSSKNIKRRWREHINRLRKNKHSNFILQNTWNKYGEENFEFKIIRIVEDENMLVPIEQFYLDMLKPRYNIGKRANTGFRGPHKLESKLKMSQSKKGNTYRKGSTLLEETKNLISKNRKGLIGPTKPIKYFNKITMEYLGKFNSITEASRKLNIGRTSINNNVSGMSKTCNKYIFNYDFN